MSQDVLTRGLCADDATCAICDEPVISYFGEPARRPTSVHRIVSADVNWCFLEPCGHTFSVQRGGLFH
jgi:hypothetical protein